MSWTEPLTALTPTELTGGSPGGGGVVSGDTLDFEQIRDEFAVQVTVSNFGGGGGFAAYNLNGSLDGTNWYNVTGSGSITSTGTFMTVVTTTPARYVQASAYASSSVSGNPETVTLAILVAAK